jgi:hypothetical protein
LEIGDPVAHRALLKLRWRARAALLEVDEQGVGRNTGVGLVLCREERTAGVGDGRTRRD